MMSDYNSVFNHIVLRQTLQASLSGKSVHVRLAVWQVRLPGQREYNPSPPASAHSPNCVGKITPKQPQLQSTSFV